MRHVKLLSALVFMALTFMLSLPLSAESCNAFAPPKLPNLDNIPATLSYPPKTKVMLGKLSIELERTPLGIAQRSAGTGVIQHRGDAADSEDLLCFTTGFGLQPQRIWFSSGELGGSQRIIDAFYASVSEAAVMDSRFCPELPQRLHPVSIGKLWLGASQEKLKGWLGKPSAKRDGWWLYSYAGKVNQDFDEVEIVGVRIVRGKVVAIFASKSTTN